MRQGICLILLLVPMLLLTLIRVHAPWFASGLQNHPELLTLVLIGFLVLGAWLTGEIFGSLKLPKISGYLLFGMLTGPYTFFQIMPSDLAAGAGPGARPQILDEMQFIKDLAVSLIALTAGGEIRFSWLKGQLTRIMVITGFMVLGVAIMVILILGGLELGTGLLFGGQISDMTVLFVLLAFVGLIASGNSPAIAIGMITETRSEGPLSRTTLAVTVCKDLAIVVIFATLLALSKSALSDDHQLSGGFIMVVGMELIGSILIGVIMGIVMGWVSKRLQKQMLLYILACCFAFALIAKQTIHIELFSKDYKFHYEALLMALSAGLAMRNVMPGITERLFHEIERMSLPVYCLFFAVVGAGMNLKIFQHFWLGILIYVVIRLVSVWIMAFLSTRLTKAEPQWRQVYWMGMTAQAGVTLALVTLMVENLQAPLVSDSVSGHIHTVRDLILGSVVAHAMAGPILFRWGLSKAGEMGKGNDHPAVAETQVIKQEQASAEK